MNVAVQMEFKADRKEPLGDLLRRVVAQFDRAGVQPQIIASFDDTPGGLRPTSAVGRALKKHPHLARFERNDAPLAGHTVALPAVRRLTNRDAETAFPIEDILALADGVPRSLPFHAISVHFAHAGFGRAAFPFGLAPPTGVIVSDGWWVNGRLRALSAMYAVDGDAASKKLPEPPAAIAAVLGGLGKPRKTGQFVAPEPAAPSVPSGSAVPKEIAQISPIVAKYRSGMAAMIERIGLPHDLPPAVDAQRQAMGASGPLKPGLVDAFKPRGYDCIGGSGVFTLRKRTAANHVIEVELDVGTWSRSLTFMFGVHGPGFHASLHPPVTTRDGGRQYPIGTTENWTRIVANLCAIVDELERTFVPELEAAVDPAPAWFQPAR